jgi:2-oxoglutarate ferredoxin oxidoreductase subunit alpha
VVEQNRDAQLRSLLLLETGVAPERLASVRYYGGLPLSTHHVIEGVKGHLEGLAAGTGGAVAGAGGGSAAGGEPERVGDALPADTT